MTKDVQCITFKLKLKLIYNSMDPGSEQYKNTTKDLNALLYLVDKEWQNTGEYKQRKKNMKIIINRLKLTLNSEIPVYGSAEYTIPKKDNDKLNKQYEDTIEQYMK